MMTKERLIEILLGAKTDYTLIYELLKNMSENELTGYIINDILPAVRDNEEFKKEFWEWLNNKNSELFYVDCPNCGRIKIDIHNEMLLGYELEFCREILKQEGTK